ncbi:MAG TPA: VWA domain-containing protein [Chryseosolibacter sp.]
MKPKPTAYAVAIIIVQLLFSLYASAQSCSSCAAPSHFDMISTPVAGGACGGVAIDFGSVDPGLTMITKLKVTNCTSPLTSITVNTEVTYTGPANQWDFGGITDAIGSQFILNAGDREFEIRFQPTAISASPYSATLTLTFNDANYGTKVYSYTFQGYCNTVALNAVLVVDRSGSMASPAYTSGTTSKITALQRAASLFYDALRTGDNFGVVKYNNTATDYIPFAARTATLPANLETSATSDINKLLPMGATAIGQGLEAGRTMLSTHPPQVDRKNILVLQTDGIENVFPPAAASVTFPANLNVYTVGLGPDVQDGLLQTISTNSGVSTGFLKVDDEVAADQKLQAFYHKILNQAHNGSMVVDPTQLFDLSQADTTVAFTASITSSDIEAEFLIIDEPTRKEFYSFQLVNPEGRVIDNTSVIGGAPVEVIKRFNYSLYRVNGRNIKDSIANQFRGDWKVIVRVKGECSPNDTLQSCTIPITFSAAVKSNLTLELTSTSPTYLPGAPVVVTVESNESGQPAATGHTTVRVKTPRNKYYTMSLNDGGVDGDVKKDDGVFSGVFTNTALAGTYEFYVSSIITNRRKEITTREEVRYVSVLFPQQKPEAKTNSFCIPCAWQIIILVLILLVLGLLILRLARKQ